MQRIKLLLYLAVLSLLMSCVTQRRCNTKFPPSVDSVYKYVVRDSIIIKDTTIYIHLPGEVVHDSIQIPCPDPGTTYIIKKVFAETSLARAEAWFQFPNIKLILVQKDTTIIKRLDNAIKEAYYWKTEYEKITVKPEPVKYIPKIYKHALSICIFIFAGAFIFVGWKIYRIFKR